jgi:hypothetical protein
MVSFHGSESVWSMSPVGMGEYEGSAAIRSFFENWLGGYEEFAATPRGNLIHREQPARGRSEGS